jgi:hypothetical protein
MGADGGKDGEARPAIAPGQLRRVQPGQGELVRDAPPAQCRARVVEGRGIQNGLVAVEGALGPVVPQSRHHPQGAVPRPGEGLDQSLPRLRQQAVVFLVPPHLHARQEAGVGQPGAAGEGRRPHPGGDRLAPGLGQGCRQVGAGGGQGRRQMGLVEGRGPIGLGEEDDDSGPPAPGRGQSSMRGLGGSPDAPPRAWASGLGRPRYGPPGLSPMGLGGDEAELLGQGQGHRAREPRPPGQAGTRQPRQVGGGGGPTEQRQHPARGGYLQGRHQPPQGPAQAGKEDRQQEEERQRQAQQQGPGHRLGQHGDHLGQIAGIGDQVDGPPIKGWGHHRQVATQHQQGQNPREASDQAPRRPSPVTRAQCKKQHQARRSPGPVPSATPPRG